MKKPPLFFLLFFFSLIGISQNKPFEKVSIDTFVSETQFGSDDSEHIEIIWWVPTEYWNVIFAQDPTTSQAEKDGIIELLKDYVIVIAIKGKIGLFGGITYEDSESIKSMTTVTFKGEELPMTKEKNISPDMNNFISLIQPMMKNMIGPMGENMQVLLFENPPNKSLLPVNPYSNDPLKFKLGNFEKEVSLPLGCLLEEKICPEDKEELNGKWNFCPIHGTKLVAKNNKE